MPFSVDTFLALAAFAMATTWSPGPNNFMLAASGATFGYWRTLPHILGVAIGFPFMLFIVTLGLGEIFRTQPTVREVVSWGGLCVMLYLAVRIALQTPKDGDDASRPLSFLGASAFQWVNPKAWVMSIGVAATFASGTSPTLGAALIAGVFILVGLTSANAWAAAGAALQRLLGRGRRLRIFNVTMGILLAVSALWMVFDR
ncbi:LysE family translocator [Acuticoccus sp. I52.16.1]|uniref:LysE family translocator n=1 Tax=Acuticoccus sp. I52.16.1 TaxID=2928472 RepID=UPI001FD47F40|nr:LysE family translocator [Acuticoccus sp. I52.16.1]UOM33578.1 LysE family translocator [Acuticoccus sp. I52.16.1]